MSLHFSITAPSFRNAICPLARLGPARARASTRKSQSRFLHRRLPRLEKLLEHYPDCSVEPQPEFDEVKMPDPPTAAEIDSFSRGGSKDCPGLRQRCRVLGMEQAGTNDELKLRLKVYFGYAGTNDEREALMYPEPEVKMYVPLSASASTGAAASASVASGSASGVSAVAAASAQATAAAQAAGLGIVGDSDDEEEDEEDEEEEGGRSVRARVVPFWMADTEWQC